MVFNPKARLNPRQVLDRRGVGGAGGIALGGGGIGLVLLLAYVLLGGDPGALSGVADPGTVTGPNSSELAEECRTGKDANERADCRIVGFVNSIQDYWTDAFAQSGSTYQPAETVLFDGSVNTACGAATSAVGPFYCPVDTNVYSTSGSTTSSTTVRRQRRTVGRGIRRGPRVRPPHCKPARRARRRVERRRRQRAAPCASNSRRTASPVSGRATPPAPASCDELTRADIAQALNAAAAVGDDRIQERVQGQVTPETWTHGSSEQRQHWFLTGYEGGRVDGCDTFRADL